MKLVNYRLLYDFVEERIGLFWKDCIVDVASAYKEYQETINAPSIYTLPSNPTAFFAQANVHIELLMNAYKYIQANTVKATYKMEDVRLSTPVPNPSKIICVGVNYADHVKEMGSEISPFPVLFSKFNNALIGPEDDIHKSSLTEKLDYEVELALVIGKKASKVNESEALDYIAGYTIANDSSARDLQKRTVQWLQGKSLDHSTPIGPWIVTKDELQNPSNLSIQSYVNGELRQSSNTKHLIFTVPFLIRFISELITLNPGDIILTGTPDGVGMGMNPQSFLEDGDIVKVEIEHIGAMQNKISQQ